MAREDVSENPTNMLWHALARIVELCLVKPWLQPTRVDVATG